MNRDEWREWRRRHVKRLVGLLFAAVSAVVESTRVIYNPREFLDAIGRLSVVITFLKHIPEFIESAWFAPTLLGVGLVLIWLDRRPTKRVADASSPAADASSPVKSNMVQMVRHAWNVLSPLQQEAVRLIYAGMGKSLETLLKDLRSSTGQDDAQLRASIEPLLGSILIQKDTSGLMGETPVLSANPALAEIVAPFLRRPRA